MQYLHVHLIRMELYIVKIIIFNRVNLAQNLKWYVVQNTIILTSFKSEYISTLNLSDFLAHRNSSDMSTFICK